MSATKYTYEQVKREFEEKGYELLSSEYHNVLEKLDYVCTKHRDKGVQQISFSKLHNCNRGCYYCGRERAGNARKIEFDIEYDKSLCEANNFEYIKTIRDKGKIVIVFICNNHRELGEQRMTKPNMKREIKGCKYCAGKSLPEWYVLKKAKDVNPFIKLLEPYKNLMTRMDCICLKHNHPTRKTMQEILKGRGCYYCGLEKVSKSNTLTNEDVQSSIDAVNPHIKIVSYKGNKQQSDFYCTKHKNYFKKFYTTVTHCKSGCEECYADNIRDNMGMGIDEFSRRLKHIHPELIILGEYVNNSTPIEVFCTKHNYTYALTPVALLDRLTCCDKTKSYYKEGQVCKLLEEQWGFKITRQKTFENCIDKRCLPFDIYLDDYNVLIEYHGEQHYIPIKYSYETVDKMMIKFEYTQRHDNIKREYCKNNNIPLIEIPYWEFEDLEYFIFDKLVKIGVIEEIKNAA